MSASSRHATHVGGAKPKAQRLSVTRTKTKTGCMTCRIRRVKCDEGKPACTRCVSTGRVCDGYPTLFRKLTFNNSPTPSSSSAIAVTMLQVPVLPSLYQIRLLEFTQQAVSELAARFDTKPSDGLVFNYEPEARATLGAVSEPEIHHAVVALHSLRETFEQDGIPSFLTSQVGSRAWHGLREYNLAVTSLASRLSNASPKSVKLALLCCQLFITIESALNNYVSTVQHSIRGLQIMQQYRSRPTLDEMGRFVAAPVEYRDLPQIDVYIIKQFLPPCPIPRYRNSGKEMMGELGKGLTSTLGAVEAPKDQTPKSQRGFVEEVREQLVSIAISVLHLLDIISCLAPTTQTTLILDERTRLLERLQVWETTFQDLCHALKNELWHPMARLSLAFVFLFHLVLKVITVLSIGASRAQVSNLQQDFDKMTKFSEFINESKRQIVTVYPTGYR